MKYQLIEISTNAVALESDTKTQHGGNWGDPAQFKWVETPASRLLDLAKTSKEEELKDAFTQSLASGFTCTNGITMDATMEAITKLESGYNLAVRLAATTMDIRDFSNATHANTPIADVDTMITELGSNYLAQWTNKNTKIDLVKSKMKVSTVEKVKW